MVLIALIVVLVQVTMWVRNALGEVREDEAKARQEAEAAAVAFQVEQGNFALLRNESASLIEFLEVWEPHLEAIDTPEGGELNISMRIKEAGLVALSQRYEVVANRTDSAIRRFVRAHLTVEDDYVETLNWLGRMETRLPALRVSSVKITRGQNPNEIRMEVMLDLPVFRTRTGGT